MKNKEKTKTKINEKKLFENDNVYLYLNNGIGCSPLNLKHTI
jgi:hypothetical protein